MTTMVGTQDDLIDAVKDLVELDYDAVEAYEAALNRLDGEFYKTKLSEFKLDHERHIEELTTHLKARNEEAPASGSLKKFLTQGKVVIGGLVGDKQILRAMKSNEEDTNKAYERMNNRPDLDEDLKNVLQRGWADEKHHFQWLEHALETKE